MFDPGLSEFILIAVIALVVLGPERLPVVARKVGRFVGAMQRMFVGFKHEVQRHVNSIEEPLKETKAELDQKINQLKDTATIAELGSVLEVNAEEEE